MEGDAFLYDVLKWHKMISIHSLRVEGDLSRRRFAADTSQFQSTPSVWRETTHPKAHHTELLRFQSTPSVWRETAFSFTVETVGALFQSTPSVWRETEDDISAYESVVDFNPLPPCGGRHIKGDPKYKDFLFQSTPSVWRETISS